MLVDIWEGTEPRPEVERFCEMWGIKGPILLDPDETLARELGVRGVPTNVVVDSDGIVREFGAARLDELEKSDRVAPHAGVDHRSVTRNERVRPIVAGRRTTVARTRPRSSAAVGELGDADAVREQVEETGAKGREPLPVTAEDELEVGAAESLGDVAAIREPQREQPCRAVPADGERLRLEAMDDRPRDAHEDDDADPEQDVHLLVRRRPRREEDERRMVAGPRARGRLRGQPERARLRAERGEAGAAASAAIPRAPRAALIRGLPCSVRAKPARVAVTTSGRAPGFRTVIDVRRRPVQLDAQRADARVRQPGFHRPPHCSGSEPLRRSRRLRGTFILAITVYVIVAV